MLKILKYSVVFVMVLCTFAFAGKNDLVKYLSPYDLSEMDWQLLNWTAAWRGTTRPADPFVLERMEYNRKEEKAHVYVDGDASQATDENLQKSIDGIVEAFRGKFSEFKPEKDLVVHYNLKPDGSANPSKIEYRGGSFGEPQPSVTSQSTY